jgi:hypothetical protein
VTVAHWEQHKGREEEEEGGARFILANGYDFYPIETSFTQLSSTLSLVLALF